MHELVYFYPTGHEAHFEPGHPERPERVEAIRRVLRDAGLWQLYPKLHPIDIGEELLATVHSPVYLAALEHACRRENYLDADTYTTRASWDLALHAAGGAAAVASTVWQRLARRGFCLTRPPGHHATHDRGMGFCLMNNIAVAAEYLVQLEGAKRLAIIDLDLHHGNGTQDIFYRRGDVFYMSIHQSPFYPGTGDMREMGDGPGMLTTANFPLLPFSGDRAYLAVMERLILPLLDRFDPQMILVSYGFDPHWSDPLGNLRLSAPTYGKLVESLVQWADQHCQGRIALFLEGGYNLEAAQACSLAVISALLGKPCPPLTGKAGGPSPEQEGTAWESVVRRACELWDL